MLKENWKSNINPIIKKLLNLVQSASANVQGARALLLKLGGVDITPEILSKNYFLRAQYLKKNPIIAAIYFNTIIKSFLEYILCACSNKTKKGLFGYVKSYYGIVEGQDIGSLHLHMLLWLIGALNPFEFKKKLENEIFIAKLINYLDSLIHCDFDGLIESNDQNIDKSSAFINEIHPCCKTIDFIDKNPINENQFLNYVYEIGKVSAIHKCTFSCFKYGSDECRFGFGLNKIGKELCQESIVCPVTGKID
jgi:hypothetical protein